MQLLSLKYAQAHAELYKNHDDAAPLKGVKHGGGSCRHNVECGGSSGGNVRTHTSTNTGSSGTANIPTTNSKDRGACVRNKCHCTSDAYTGPYCLVSVV